MPSFVILRCLSPLGSQQLLILTDWIICSEQKDLQALKFSVSYPEKPHITPLAVLSLDNRLSVSWTWKLEFLFFQVLLQQLPLLRTTRTEKASVERRSCGQKEEINLCKTTQLILLLLMPASKFSKNNCLNLATASSYKTLRNLTQRNLVK